MNHLSYEELVDKKICPDRIEFPNGRVWKNEQGDRLIRFKGIEFCQVSYVCKPFPKQHALSVCLTYYEDSRKRSKGLIAQCDLTAGFEEDSSEFVTNESPRSKLRGITLETCEDHNSYLCYLDVGCIFSYSQGPLSGLLFLQSHHRSTIPHPTIAL